MAKHTTNRNRKTAADGAGMTSAATPAPSTVLRNTLDSAHSEMERLQHMLRVCIKALYDQDCDIDMGVAICLEAACEGSVRPAAECIEKALALLPEVSNG